MIANYNFLKANFIEIILVICYFSSSIDSVAVVLVQLNLSIFKSTKVFTGRQIDSSSLMVELYLLSSVC